jgi:hypothetical protein
MTATLSPPSQTDVRRAAEHMRRLNPPTTKTAQDVDDWAKLRVALPTGEVLAGPNGMELRDGDEVYLPRGEAANLVKARHGAILGYTPMIPAPRAEVEGGLRTVIMLDTGEPSPYLERRPNRGEVVTLPATEARDYVEVELAIFAHASARAEVEAASAALVADAKTPESRRAASRALALAIRALVRSEKLERHYRDVCDDVDGVG